MQSIDKCSIRPTKHAKDKMIGEAVGKDKIREILRFGFKRSQINKIISKMGNIEVVYRIKPCNIIIITLYVDTR